MLLVILVEGLLAFFAFRLMLTDEVKMWKAWKKVESHYAFLSVFLTIVYMAYCVSQIV